MRLDAIAVGYNPPDDINVIVEVSVGGEPIKYELDKESGALVVGRFLYTSMTHPGNYGFIPNTLSEDGDPQMCWCAIHVPIVPGAVMNCRPVGVLRMEDDGATDEKIIAVPSEKLTQRYVHARDGDALEPNKWVKLDGWGDANDAGELIRQGMDRSRA